MESSDSANQTPDSIIRGWVLTLGIAIGTPIAHALPQRPLRRLLGSAVLLAGGAMLVRTAARL